MLDLFPGTKTRKPKRVIAHVCDAGASDMQGVKTFTKFECKKCGWKSAWLHFATDAEVRRGVPCENCN